MPQRQQRSNSARGSQPTGVVAYAPEITWQIYQVDTFTVDLLLSVPAPHLVIGSVPKFVRSFGNAVPATAVRFFNFLRLTFATLNPPGFTLTLRAQDPAVRSRVGAYLAPGVQTHDGPSQTTVGFVSSSFLGEHQVTVYDNPLGGPITLPPAFAEGVTIWLSYTGLSVGDMDVFLSDGATLVVTVAPGSNTRFVSQGGVWVLAP